MKYAFLLITLVLSSTPSMAFWWQSNDPTKMKGRLHLHCTLKSSKNEGHIGGYPWNDETTFNNHKGWPIVLRFDDMKANQGKGGSVVEMATYKDRVLLRNQTTEKTYKEEEINDSRFEITFPSLEFNWIDSHLTLKNKNGRQKIYSAYKTIRKGSCAKA